MTVEPGQVRRLLEAEEPDYPAAIALGPECLPQVESLIRDPDPMLASKAAYLASQIPHPQAVEALKVAAERPEPQVRVAAASGSRLASTAETILPNLLEDQDEGVQTAALRSACVVRSTSLRPIVERVAATTSSPRMQELALEVLGSETELASPAPARALAGEGVGEIIPPRAASRTSFAEGGSSREGEGVGDVGQPTPAVELLGESIGDIAPKTKAGAGAKANRAKKSAKPKPRGETEPLTVPRKRPLKRSRKRDS